MSEVQELAARLEGKSSAEIEAVLTDWIRRRLVPYVQMELDLLEDEVDREMCHTEAQKSIAAQIASAKAFLREMEETCSE